MKRQYGFVAWRSEGLWTVHSPSIPGVYGVGKTVEEAREDFIAAASDMVEYLAEIGEPPPRPADMCVGQVEL